MLIAASVAIAVAFAVLEVQHRTEHAIVDSNLGVAQTAAVLAAGVAERQHALAAAAKDWIKFSQGSPEGSGTFLSRQSALKVLFNTVEINAAKAFPDTDQAGYSAASMPLRNLPGLDASDIAIIAPLKSNSGTNLVLTGILQLRQSNFLASTAVAALLDDTHIRTVVSDQQGYILAHANDQQVLTLIGDTPDLAEAVASWRARGSPLESTPKTARYGQYFVAMVSVPGTDWMVFRIGDAEALFSETGRAITRTILMGVAVGLAGAGAIFVLTAQLLQPMTRLRLRILKALDPSQPANLGWPQTGGEVGELSQVLKHVSEQLSASRAEIESSLNQIQAILTHAPVGIGFTCGPQFELASLQLEHLLGYQPGELTGPWERLLADESQRDNLRSATAIAFQEGRPFEAEVKLKRRDDSDIWVRLHGAEIQKEPQRVIWIVSDATRDRLQREDLIWTSTRDPLTELINRREFERLLTDLLGDRRRHTPACALFIDLDNFKQVNDGAGHAAGDQILKIVATSLQSKVRSRDAVARLGGDEFAVLLRDCDLDRAVQIAESMRQHIEMAGVCETDTSLRVTTSIGVVEILAELHSLADVLQAADRACYSAKHSGRNAVRTATA